MSKQMTNFWNSKRSRNKIWERRRCIGDGGSMAVLCTDDSQESMS
jgi:hypothetical protein